MTVKRKLAQKAPIAPDTAAPAARPAVELAAVSDSSPEAAAPSAPRKLPENPSLPMLTGSERSRLIAAASLAYDNNATLDLQDGLNRNWFVAPSVINNNSYILIRLTRGVDIREQPISTAVFSVQSAADAVDALSAALPNILEIEQ